jgi:hypothetical protein
MLLRRIRYRLRLSYLRLRPASANPTASALPSCLPQYSLPRRNHDWPIKSTILAYKLNGSMLLTLSITRWVGYYAFGGPEGSRTPVRSTFLLASYNYNLVLNIGFELMTFGLQNHCSTTELIQLKCNNLYSLVRIPG